MNIKEIYDIKQDKKAGLSVEEIAEIRNLSISTVKRALYGKTGKKQRQIADRWEYFRGDEQLKTGNLVNGEAEYCSDDVVLEEILMMEALENVEEIK